MRNCYYDRQMCGANNTISGAEIEGKLTSAMVTPAWTALGSNYLFEYQGSIDNYYPHLKGFNEDNYAVRLSTLPIVFNGEQTANDVRENFTVGGTHDGFKWQSTVENYAKVKDAPQDYVVEVFKQGWTQLTCQHDVYTNYTRSLALYINKTPYIGTEENPFTIDNINDLKKFRDGINKATTFWYKHFQVPAGAANTYFKQTADISIASVTNWSGTNRISKANDGSAFAGIYDGGGHQLHIIIMVSLLFVKPFLQNSR